MTDYTETRACLIRARATLDNASRTIARVNLAPGRAPHDIGEEIKAIISMIKEGEIALREARYSCFKEARKGLAVVDRG